MRLAFDELKGKLNALALLYLEAIPGNEPSLAPYSRNAVLVGREGHPEEPQQRHDEHGHRVEWPQQPMRREGTGGERLNAKRDVQHVQHIHAVRQIHEIRLLLPPLAHGMVERVGGWVHGAAQVVVERHEQAEVGVHLRVMQRMVPAPPDDSPISDHATIFTTRNRSFGGGCLVRGLTWACR